MCLYLYTADTLCQLFQSEGCDYIHLVVHMYTHILSSTHITYNCTQSCDYTMLSHSQTRF